MLKNTAIATAAVVVTLLFEHLLPSIPVTLSAQEPVTREGYVLFAGVRRDTEKNESFIFFNPKDGTIWVYEDARVKNHYRLNKVGENLEKLD